MNPLAYSKKYLPAIFLLNFLQSFKYVKNIMNGINTLAKTTFSGRRFTRKQLEEVQETVQRFQNLSRKKLALTLRRNFYRCVMPFPEMPPGSLKPFWPTVLPWPQKVC